MLIHSDIVQHSDSWYAIKAGKFSASSAATFMSGKDTKGLSDLIKTVAWGRAFGHVDEPRFQSSAMKRGNELEGEARNWYAFETGTLVTEVGFVEPGDGRHIGWSPDGVILKSGQITHAVEIKCLLHKAYMDVLATRKIPNEYKWQVRWAMWIGGLQEMDFVAYHPQAGGVIVPVTLKQEHVEKIESRLELAEKEAAQWIERLSASPEEAEETEYEIII